MLGSGRNQQAIVCMLLRHQEARAGPPLSSPWFQIQTGIQTGLKIEARAEDSLAKVMNEVWVVS